MDESSVFFRPRESMIPTWEKFIGSKRQDGGMALREELAKID